MSGATALDLSQIRTDALSAAATFRALIGVYSSAQVDALIPSLSGYATTSYVDSGLAGKANFSHTHTLSDISDAGTAAGSDTGDFATAAQGSLAASALQPSDIASGTITPKTGDLDLNSLGGGGSQLRGFRAVSGHWYNSQRIRNAGSLVTHSANTLYLYPIRFSTTETWTAIWLHCQATGSATARLGIYFPDDSGDGLSVTAATLAVDAGTVTNASTGAREITGISQEIAANRIALLAVLTNGTFQSLGVPATSGLYEPLLAGHAASFNIDRINAIVKTSVTYGALPSTVTGATPMAVNLPHVGLRL